MFEKLFGIKSEEEQLKYLENRLAISGVVIAASIIISFFAGEEALALIAIVLYVWAWDFIRVIFGGASLATILFGYHNIALGVVVAFVFLLLGYLAGIFYFVMGIIYYLILKFA